ncbi:hypothetical protein ACA910_014774 [Epithemia clementina (nom. ined.)]
MSKDGFEDYRITLREGPTSSPSTLPSVSHMPSSGEGLEGQEVITPSPSVSGMPSTLRDFKEQDLGTPSPSVSGMSSTSLGEEGVMTPSPSVSHMPSTDAAANVRCLTSKEGFVDLRLTLRGAPSSSPSTLPSLSYMPTSGDGLEGQEVNTPSPSVSGMPSGGDDSGEQEEGEIACGDAQCPSEEVCCMLGGSSSSSPLRSIAPTCFRKEVLSNNR